MLLGKNRYNYMDMVILYFKLAPVSAIAKIIYNFIVAIIPTINIFVTAMFLDSAIVVVSKSWDLGAVIIPLLAIMIIQLFNVYAGIIVGLINARASNRIKKIVRPALAEKIFSVKYKYYENQDSVEIMDRAQGGFEGNIHEFFDVFLNVCSVLTEIFGFIFILFLQNRLVPFIFVITYIPSFIISYRFGQKRYDVDKAISKVNREAAYISEILRGRDTLEERYMYGYTDKMNQKYSVKYNSVRIARKNVSKSLWTHLTAASILTFVSGAIIIVTLIPSVIPPATGEAKLSAGMFISLVNAILCLSKKQDVISDYICTIRYELEYLKDLNVFLSFDEDEEAVCLPNTRTVMLKTIEFKNVCFRYPDCEPYILKDFNIALNAGKHYAVVGLNGAGKTTLVKLLTGLYDNYEGEILINNKELREFTQSERRGLCAVVYQDFCRYPLNLYNNIAIGNITQMDDFHKIKNAVEVIGLTDAVNKLPENYNTEITKIKDTGVDLSGGEWQKIALARLIVSPAPIKILDEPTASLDPISESRIYEQFSRIVNCNLDADGVAIFISHRLGSTKLADEIIVISEGRVAEVGTFYELINKGGIFSEMYVAQAGWYRDTKVKP